MVDRDGAVNTQASADDGEPRLLVPINVQALASVQSFMGSVANWSIVPMNYSQLESFESPEPANLFNGQNLTIAGGQPWTGVILHWALPDALTHGTQASAGSPPGSPPSTNGEITFPPVPNRWLVLRTSMDPNHPNDPEHRITRVWALQSDYVDIPGYASNSFSYDFTDSGQEYYIGRSWLLTNPPPACSTSPSSAELQAIGPGDATFAAYMANINDVFSFRDDLMLDFPQNNLSVPQAWTGQNPPAIGAGLPLTYMVAGWYSDPTQDPLYNWQALGDDGWEKLLAQLGWSVDDATVKPSQILCHGSVYGVNWLGRTGEVQSGIPLQKKLPMVAVGNTSVEALAAIIEQQINEKQGGQASPAETGEQVAEILEAFQYNLLSLYDQPGGQAKINQQKYQAGFGSGQGGTLWDIIRPLPPETSPPAPQSPPDTQPPVLTEQQSMWLVQLNSLQQDYDQLSRQLDSMQLELFSDWWKKIYTLFLASPFYNKARAAYLKLKAQVQAQQTALDRILNGAEGLESVKQQLSDSLGDSLQLVSKEAPRFWHPVDPVVLVCGAKGSFKHGEDPLYTDDGTLFCRVTGQAIDAMTVTGGKSSATVTGTDLISSAQRTNPFPSNAATLALIAPPMTDINALFSETLLLDTTNAMMIAQAAVARFQPPDNSIPPATLAPSIVALQNSIWNFTLHDALNRQAPADHPNFNGMIPSKNSLEFWSPPWSPLYLDWQVEWLPSWSNMEAVMNGWQFDAPVSASDKQLDYQWVSPSPPDPNSDPFLTFQGRTLLTPKAADAFAARLEQFLEHIDPGISGYTPPESLYGSPPFDFQASPPEDISVALGEVMNMISNWDILSQSLSGLHQQLIMRDPGQHVPLTSQSLTELLNNSNQPLEPGETVQGLLDLFGGSDKSLPLAQVPTSGPPRYNPIRAGHFVIKKLWVVDDFGQVYNVFTDSESNPYLQPVISEALCTPAPGQTPTFLPGVVQLTPRFVQPSRLNFRFVSATDESRETTSDPLTNPVCGWVLPNHLDKGLTIYDAGGNALGELVLAGGASNRRLRWEPIPNTPAPVGAPPDIANKHLRGFVEGLLAQSDGGKTFLDLLSVIDETLWTTDPLGGRADQSLSVLIGRPLALVRASLELELQGNPVYDQGWATTGQQVQTFPFPASTGQPNFTDIPFTVHLGNLELRDDGLLGYFTNDNYQQFNSLRMPEESSPSSYFIQQDFTLTPDSDAISPASESVSVVTMLIDPRGYVYANTGILPIKQIALPGEYVEPALKRMDVTFRTGPVLTDTEALRMPLPSFSRGRWSWIQHTGVTVWQEDSNIAKADPKPRLTDIPLSLREGWLKLSKPMADDE